ncbi:MAG: TetR/AcrR family transcriptional regulator [Myxococcales bacterium]|nr:MAG: TetR/AcrR family transcriptional regulator [Myxococcales bacterium]
MAGGWLREEQADLAVDKILNAAAHAFVELGVSAASMSDIARYAGCSRGTLYRYFKTRHDLHLAFVNRTAVELAARVGAEVSSIEDPVEHVVESVLRSVYHVRNTPAAAAWFAPADAGLGAGISRGSETIDALTTTFIARLVGEREDESSDRLLARWLVRVILSLLTSPGESAEEERTLVARFVAPAIVR